MNFDTQKVVDVIVDWYENKYKSKENIGIDSLGRWHVKDDTIELIYEYIGDEHDELMQEVGHDSEGDGFCYFDLYGDTKLREYLKAVDSGSRNAHMDYEAVLRDPRIVKITTDRKNYIDSINSQLNSGIYDYIIDRIAGKAFEAGIAGIPAEHLTKLCNPREVEDFCRDMQVITKGLDTETFVSVIREASIKAIAKLVLNS